MKRYLSQLLFCLVLFFASYHACSQKPFLLSEFRDGKNLEFLKSMAYFSADSLWSIDAVMSEYHQQFKVFEKGIQNFGFTSKYYWLRFSINNNSLSEKNLLLLSANAGINQLELFVKKNGQVNSLGRTGDLYPFSQRPVNFLSFSYPLRIPRGAADTFYLFVDKRNENLGLGFGLFDERAFQQFGQYIYLISGVLAGILLMALFFNFFLWLNTREKLHLWYCLYAFSVVAYFFAWKGLDFQFLTPNFPVWANISRLIFSNLIMFFLLLVMQAILEQSKNNSKFFRAVNISKWLLLTYVIAGVLIYTSYPSLNNKRFYHYSNIFLTFSSLLLIYLTCIEQLRKGNRFAMLYLIAVFFLAIAIMQTYLSIVGVVNYNHYQPTLVEIGSMVEALIICFAILYRYILFRKRQAELALEVQEQKANLIKNIVDVQQAEQSRIAKDLHDEIGGDLAAIKMTLQSLPLQSEKLHTVLHLLDKASDNARNISHNLMPPEFSSTPLCDVLLTYFEQLNSESNLSFDFICQKYKASFSKADELVIYRILMELTNNVIKHAHASEATIQLIYEEEKLEIMLEDNGIGFSPDKTRGMGLKNVEARVAYLSGQLTIDASVKGTTIIINLPYKFNGTKN